MFPLLPFAAGLLTGAVAIKLIKTDKTKASLGKVQDRLRDATVSSLAAIEHSSANLRTRLTTPPAAVAEPENPAAPQAAAEPAPSPASAEPPAQKPVRRKRTPKAAQAATARTAAGNSDETAS